MHASRDALLILFGEDPAAIRGADWGALRMSRGLTLNLLASGLTICSCCRSTAMHSCFVRAQPQRSNHSPVSTNPHRVASNASLRHEATGP